MDQLQLIRLSAIHACHPKREVAGLALATDLRPEALTLDGVGQVVTHGPTGVQVRGPPAAAGEPADVAPGPHKLPGTPAAAARLSSYRAPQWCRSRVV